MIIVNTTFLINTDIAEAVLSWVNDSYAASAVKCDAVESPTLWRVLSHAEPGTVVYALHAPFATIDDAERWDHGVADKLRQRMAARWGEGALSFQTYLETVR